MLLNPYLRPMIWGGVRLKTKYNKVSESENIGESWELTIRPEAVSTIANGVYEGKRLCDVMNYDGTFPLLIKFIDARDKLSVQVHPDDDITDTNGLPLGKTEMWYILQADKGARVFAGLRTDATRQKFLDRIRESDVLEQVQGFDSVVGDAYFIPGGRLHCLGQGNLVLEISRNSDTTFRLSDWNREDAGGLHRELHVRDAVTCLDFSDRAVPRVCGVSNRTSHNRKYSLISHCPFFHCDKLMLVEDWRDATDVRTGFHILTAVNQPFTVENSRFCTRVGVFESVLIPACFGDYMVRVTPGTEGTDIIRTTL